MTNPSKGFKRHRVNVLGVNVDDLPTKNALEVLFSLAKDTKKSHYAVTVNSEFVMLARRNKDFAKVLNKADLSFADGAFLAISKLIFGGKYQNRITGVDLIEKVCEKSVERNVRIGFLGGFGDVAERVAKRQISLNPGLKVVLAEPGDPAIGYDLRLKNKISRLGRIDVLFVAYGMGKQEFWISRNLGMKNVGIFVGVGGAFDYLSGEKIRAPKVFQQVGMEWLWRLVLEPARIWRMRVLPAFFVIVVFFGIFGFFTKTPKN